MNFLEKQIEELEKIDVPKTARPDFDKFWEETLEKVENKKLNVKSKVIDHPFKSAEIRELTYEGLDGTPVSTYLMLPKEAKTGSVPVVIAYHGFTWHKMYPEQYAHWLMVGVAVIAIDFRLQAGTTGSNSGFPQGMGQYYVNLGILDINKYYNYHLITDALLAVKLARETKEIDINKIAVEGASQGGAISLTVSALDKSVSLSMALVPSTSWIEKRIMERTGSFANVGEYIARHPQHLDKILETLSYVDNINFADKINCPILVGLGLKDPGCTPETVYASINKIKSEKKIIPYAFQEHNAGATQFVIEKLNFLKEHFGE